MPFAYENGLDVYVCDRTYPLDEPWKIEIYNQKYTSANPVIDTERSGMYSGDKVHVIDEGYEFDLGNCKFKVVHLPGHEDSSLLLYGADTGLLFSSDIYAVNRYWVADQFAAKGGKARFAFVVASATYGYLYQRWSQGKRALYGT